MSPLKKREGFPGQRIVVLPGTVMRQAQEQVLTRGIVPTDIGYFPHAEGHLRERPKGVDQAIFIYCVKGRGWCRMAGQLHQVRTGEVLIIPPGTSHVYGAQAREPWTICWFHAKGDVLAAFLDEINVSAEHPVIFLGNDTQWVGLFEEALEVMERGYTPQQLLHASHALAHLLAVMVRHRHENWRSEPDARQRISRTISHMKQYLDQPLHLDELAAVANLSRSRYASLFKDQTGYAPVDYFIRMRMHYACQLLDTTALRVKAVAASIGYEDPLYFSRVFRSVNGLAPTDYRNRKKG